MAAGLFAKAAHQHDASDALSASAGFLEGGRPVHEHAASLLSFRGIDVRRKQSQKLSPEIVEHADLILAMTSEHARGVVSRFPETLPRVFTLRHFGSVVVPRPSALSTKEWLDQIHEENKRAYLSDDALLDIPDPIGHDRKVFEGLATELENTISWIMDCAYSAKVSGESSVSVAN